MTNLDFILFLFFVVVVLIIRRVKQQRVQAPQQGFPESELDDYSAADWQKPTVSNDAASIYRNRSIDHDWCGGGASEYEPAPVPQAPKVSVRKPPTPQRASTSSFKPTSIATQFESSLTQRISAAKVAKRTSSFADHFRQKRSIQLAVVDRVVLGPCRANAPFGEHQ